MAPYVKTAVSFLTIPNPFAEYWMRRREGTYLLLADENKLMASSPEEVDVL